MRPSLALRARGVVSMQPSVVLHARRSLTKALAVMPPAEVNSRLAPAVLEGTPSAVRHAACASWMRHQPGGFMAGSSSG